MEIISHRGNGFGFPENSLPAFEAALRQGFSIELDIRMSKDSVPFIIHNPSVEGLLDGEGKIVDTTSDQLERLCYKNNKELNLLSFEDFVRVFDEIGNKSSVFVHIQDINEEGAMDKVNSILESTLTSKKNFSLFAVDEMSLPLVKLVKYKYKYIKVGLHLPENSRHFNEADFKLPDFIWADEVKGNWLSKDMADMAHKLGKKIYGVSPELIAGSSYHTKYKSRFKDMVNFGFDGVCTDHPLELL